MTAVERNDIFAKEYLGIDDIAKLYGLSYNRASILIREIKRKITMGQGKSLRVEMRGKIHTQDYLEWRETV